VIRSGGTSHRAPACCAFSNAARASATLTFACDSASVVVQLVLRREHYLLKGYRADDRICYGTWQIVASEEVPRL
jgi:hypothetical protein